VLAVPEGEAIDEKNENRQRLDFPSAIREKIIEQAGSSDKDVGQ
jgi:hypothetical protein